MAKPIYTPDRLLNRPWQPTHRHPFRRQVGRGRRVCMFVLLVVLCAAIGAYWYVTDSRRVKGMAEGYLSSLLGGRVEVGSANLSIFEGLKLKDVRVYVDNRRADDSIVFSADTFELQYNPEALLRGKLEATQIKAIEPHVRLTENPEELLGHRWNYQRMSGMRTARMPRASQPGSKPPVLPEIILRNAQVDYAEIEGGRYRGLGSLGIEGHLTPLAGDRYAFELQSRGAQEGVGPRVEHGVLNMSTGQVSASLWDFDFGRDIKTMLPVQVRQWWEQHGLSGRVDVPQLVYTPERPGQKGGYRVETELRGVTLNVQPQEWMSAEENQRLQWMQDAFDVMRLVGLNHTAAVPKPEEAAGPAVRGEAGEGGVATASDFQPLGFVDHLQGLVEPSPIRLQRAEGSFVFTEGGIEVRDVTGRIENNGFKINGKILSSGPGRYTPDAAFGLTVSTLDTENLYLPPSPRYLNSVPRQVREVYSHFLPQGTCRLAISLTRPTPGRGPEVTGTVDILDGQFSFDKFPYPLQGVTGQIVFARDESSGLDRIELRGIRGRGLAGGPNANSQVTMEGLIGPLAPDCGVNIRITGTGISTEPAIRSAFPPEVRQALKVLDAAGKGEYPKFHGNFVCDVIRPIGHDTHWRIDTDLDIDDASGALVPFPYPLTGVKTKLRIREGYVDIVGAEMKRADSSLKIDGRVAWGKPGQKPGATAGAAVTTGGEPSLDPELTVTARNVPIDADLLAALPADRRAWIEKAGLGGKIDIDGRIGRDAGVAAGGVGGVVGSSPAAFDMAIRLKEGTIWPAEGTFAATDLSGDLRLQPERMELKNFKGRRGESAVWGEGTVRFPPHETPEVTLTAGASKLALDGPLYHLLPAAAKAGWDAVRPEGTVDAKVTYSGRPGANASAAVAAGAGQAASGFEVQITPVALAVTPTAVPYRLTNLAGNVTVSPEHIVLSDVTGRHGASTVAVSGTGTVGATTATPTTSSRTWDLKLSGRDVLVDGELRRALPAALGTMLDSLKLGGRVGFDFSKLRVTGGSEGTSGDSGDVEFATKITAAGSSVDVGVPLKDVAGVVSLAGSTRGGRLYDLNGDIALEKMMLADRPVQDFRATLEKPAGKASLSLGKMQAQLAGGDLAGQVDLTFPDEGANRYAINLVLRNADVRQLTQEGDGAEGQASASLSLEGNWSDPASRRGRGDATVTGRQLYKIPLVLGLLQITNLALPVSGPFSEGTARYIVEGSRVTFEGIDLRASNMAMSGTGHLDFDTKQVRMDFVTDNPNLPKLPVIQDLLRGAQQELLQIHVRGTVQDPKVSASAMNTLSTTVDEVFKGGEKR